MSYAALGFDPAPGSPSQGEAMARRLREATRALEEMDHVLSGTGDQQWVGRTAVAFHGLVDEGLKPRVREAHLSFATASRALDRWLVDLEDHQRRARALEAEAEAARARVEAARSALDGLSVPTGDDPERQRRFEQDRSTHQDRLRNAQGALDDVVRRANALAQEATASARTTAAALDTAKKVAPDKPGLWDRVSDALADVGDFLGDVVEFVRDNWFDLLHQLVSITATVLAVASLFFPALAPFALAFAIADVLMSGWDWAHGVPGAKEAFLTGALGLVGGFAVGKLVGAFMDVAGPALAAGPFQAVASGATSYAGMAVPAAAVLSYNPKFGPALGGFLVIKVKDAKDASDSIQSLLGNNAYYSGRLAAGWRKARES